MRNLYSEVKKNIADLSGTITGNSYLLGVSGGVDSIVLLQVFLQLKQEFLFEFEVATVDHALREESAEETAYIQKVCAQNNIKFHTVEWTQDLQDQTGTNENQARLFRYSFFNEVMEANNLRNLVLAHHADDQAETVLMKLVRGGNLREVQAIKPQRNFNQFNLLRPLLEFSKEEIRNYARENNLKYFEDITNSDDFTMRNRLRNHVMPQLKSENPQMLAHLTNFTNQLRTANTILERYYNPIFLNDFSHDLLKGSLRSLKELSIDENILFWNIYKSKAQMFHLNDKQIKQISHAIKSDRPNMEVSLDDNQRFVKNHDQFSIEEDKLALAINDEIPLNKKITISNGQTAIINDQIKNSNSIKLASNAIPEHIILRTRRPGDILEIGDGHHQKLKKRMIDLKLSKKQKENALILTFDDKIVWVDGIYNSANYQKDKKYSFYLQIRGDVDETK